MNESTRLEEMLDAVRVPRIGDGWPRKRPERLIADRGYNCPFCRRLLRRRGIPHAIPERKDQHERRRRRPPGFDRKAYRKRNMVEKCVNRLKQRRGVAMRYEKRAANYRAVAVIASRKIFW